jgi:steroid delta-isomerase-like uncharacterized protein
MSAAETRRIVRAYYQAFNKGDTDSMLALIADDIAHDVNEGETRKGKARFAEFNAHMTRCYKEKLKDIVIMVGKGGKRASAEFIVDGKYLATDAGLPPANGQKYRLPAGAFFEVADGKITRVTTYYNLKNWMNQVAPMAA